MTIFRKIDLFNKEKKVVSEVIFLGISRIWVLSTSYSFPQETQSGLVGPWFSSQQQAFTNFTSILLLVNFDLRWFCTFTRFGYVSFSQWCLRSTRPLSLCKLFRANLITRIIMHGGGVSLWRDICEGKASKKKEKRKL